MRLIDADLLIEGRVENDPVVIAALCAPTAYDPDKIVVQLEGLKKAANPWIPITERLPETDDYILISFENYTLPDIGRYEIDADGNGAFYPGDEAVSYASMGIFVNAWMPLPKSYRESEGQEEKRSSKMPEAAVDFIRRRFMTRQ